MAVTHYYVDPSLPGDQGNGLKGDPWSNLTYAFTQASQTGQPTQFNIKDTGVDTPPSTFTWPAWPQDSANFITVRGYTTDENDGGMGVIDGGAGAFPLFSGRAYTGLVDLELRNTGTSPISQNPSYLSYIARCHLHGCANEAIGGGNGEGYVYNCLFHDCQYGMVGYSNFVANRFEGRATDTNKMIVALFLDSSPINTLIEVRDNIIWYSGAHPSNAGGIQTGPFQINFRITGNSIYHGNNGSWWGIRLRDGANSMIYNNLVEGWSGGGVGIEANSTGQAGCTIYGRNSVFNCSTSFTNTGDVSFNVGRDEVLGSSPFIDAPNGDMRPADVGQVRKDAYPDDIGQINEKDRGALQIVPAGGGGGNKVSGGIIGIQ